MPPIADLIQQGSTNLWLFIPSAILLGALHGLEPGHSKTMMASFIIAIRGTIGQAILLGLCAALSHSLIVWALAAIALKFGNQFIAEQAEPYFMLLSGAVVIGVAVWMFMRTRWDDLAARAQTHAPHGGRIINTGHGVVELQVFEEGVPPRFRLYGYDHHMHPTPFKSHDTIELETIRADGTRQAFTLDARGEYLESREVIPEPHEFEVLLSIGHGDHAHRFEVTFSEDGHGHGHHGHGLHHHDHDHDHGHHHGHDHSHAFESSGEYQDAHERAHAEDIQRRFAGRKVTTPQIAMFGLTGGLMPCPASVTILMICLHLKRFTLGAAMVASFSIGLAISLVSVGVIAAWGTRHVSQRFGNLGNLARKMPYLSSVLMMVVGAVMGIQGLVHIAA
ncbi:nickel/cobalt efflux transporter [Crenobacter sp. SG2303]|uniref:Nickel/cobalt efflux system n=1 Tax=Crenobacter oryzisoli TaxID=3056844 RepID=A0ABT7XLA6_9NEIS|nr:MULTISPECIES: nickel/cobalt efflux transporter [unclassified Crenobacter]MDN0074561.1 nickel/cobalt efflux transporter [Crenobacter sp. SG2303]MDN0082556.1 nickel/cobalt efflux transporter [Crenobacter sp. SG2305]